MEYRHLGKTDIQISEIGLGTMTWGEQNTEEDAHRQLDFAVERGVNLIDTAEMYPVPPKKETFGDAERYIGSWLAKRNARDTVVLATKVCGPTAALNYIRGGKNRLNRFNIEEALDRSLERLQTDYIDLYQLHWPDRRTNFFGMRGFEPEPDDEFVPFLDTLEVLKLLLDSGKIKHYGVSNETPWGLMTLIRSADQLGMPHPVSVQNPYSLLNRIFEIGCAEVAWRESISLLAYSPLGFGILSGKYLKGQNPEGSRMRRFKGHFERYNSNEAMAATAKYQKLAEKHKLNLSEMALAFLLTRPYLGSVLIGATQISQLQENMAVCNTIIDDDLISGINKIHESIPNPSP